GLLNKYLAVTQRRLRAVIARYVIPRPHTQTGENAVRSDLAERPGVEYGWWKSSQRTRYGRSGERCRRIWRCGWRSRRRSGSLLRRRGGSWRLRQQNRFLGI